MMSARSSTCEAKFTARAYVPSGDMKFRFKVFRERCARISEDGSSQYATSMARPRKSGVGEPPPLYLPVNSFCHPIRYDMCMEIWTTVGASIDVLVPATWRLVNRYRGVSCHTKVCSVNGLARPSHPP